MTQTAHIVGTVEFRPGDGPKVAIRRGPIDVDFNLTDATLSWVDGQTHGVAAMPLTEFKRYLAEGAIKFNS